MNATPAALPGRSVGRPVGIQARVQAAGRYLVEVGGEATSAEIGQGAGCTNTKMRGELLQRLEAEELVTRFTGRARLTPAGWARFSGQVLDVGAGDVVDRALAGWPTAHRAFLELLLSAVVARHHLREVPDEHLGFVAIGETGTGKTAMADLVVHLFGLSPQLSKLHLPAQAAGAILGRRERVEGGGYRLDPNPVTLQPFVFMDEVDKATADVRRNVWTYFQGERAMLVDGQVHELAPTPMLAANPPRSGERYAVVGQEYRRRSVVLDTSYLRGKRTLPPLLRRYYADAATNRLDLSRLVLPATQMSDQGYDVLELFETQLTAAGLEEFPGAKALSQVALGRAALMGTHDLGLAAYATGVSYLLATETVDDMVLSGWAPDAASVHTVFAGAPVEVGRLLAAVEAGRAEREQAARERADRQRSEQMAVAVRDARTAEVQAVLTARIDQARAGIDSAQLRNAGVEVKRTAKGLRAHLATVRDRVAAAATLEDLQALAQEVAIDPVMRAEQLRRDELVRQQQVRADAVERQRLEQQARLDARAAEAQRKAQIVETRRQLRVRLHQVQDLARPLERLYARRVTQAHDNPLAELAQLRIDGQPLLRFTRPPAPAPVTGTRTRRLLGTLAQAAAGERTGTWDIVWPFAGGPVSFPGYATSCPALAQWGPGTRAVLAGPMAGLHAHEDQVVTQLQLTGRARRRRPQVDVADLHPERPGLPSPAQRSALPRGPSGR